ncbi:hypothetical protein RRG08_051173 [Elysia crispata]|uniref:Nuclease HARBI1 n=1 Tax=Elysia crispata TaxID=231223 RepID=A0AAE0YMI0_9GAST|nr:hypothetical protein RRG08_051173 [Elysia crispata]
MAVLRHRRLQILPRPRLFRERQNPLELFDDLELYTKFRFTREGIFQLCEELNEFLQNTGGNGGSLSVSIQVCLALRFFATGTFQDAVGELIGVAQPTVSRTIHRVIDALLQLLPIYVHPPDSSRDATVNGFIQ